MCRRLSPSALDVATRTRCAPSPRAAGRGWPERSEGRVRGRLASDSTRNALQLRKNHGENALLVGQYVGIPES